MISDNQVVVDGLMTHYRKFTRASELTAVILHGWGDNSVGFENFQKELSFSSIALDLPGFGVSDAPNRTWGLDDYAGFVQHFLQKTSINPDIIIGHSNGGAIALRGIAQDKLAPEKLVLLASAGIRDQYNGRKKVLRMVAKGTKVITKPLPSKLQDKLKRRAYATIGSDLFVAEHLQDTFKKVVSDDVQADAVLIRIPTLLIYGLNDTATPVQYGEVFQKCIATSRLELVPDAGHFVHLDQQKHVLRLIKEFTQ